MTVEKEKLENGVKNWGNAGSPPILDGGWGLALPSPRDNEHNAPRDPKRALQRAHTHTHRQRLSCLLCARGSLLLQVFLSLPSVLQFTQKKKGAEERASPPPFLSPPSGYAGEGGRERGATWSGGEEGGGGHDIKADGLCLGARCQVGGGRGGGVNYHHHLLLHHHTFSSSLATRRKLDLFPGTDGALFK